MTWLWWALGSVIGLLAFMMTAGFFLRWFSEVHAERARELFKLQRERLEQKFFEAAAGSGKPRGLIWKEIDWESLIEFARDNASRQIIAVVGITIRFEAVPGSDMEGLSAVDNLRNASAVFFFDKGRWHTAGKALFNTNPGEIFERFPGQYERLRR